jgi:excisionase family DNA binding protein
MQENDDLRQPPLSYPIAELPAETGVSRSVIYTEIRKGHLTTFKVGAKRYARYEAVMDWLKRLEIMTGQSAA